jgi:hypothetical protein
MRIPSLFSYRTGGWPQLIMVLPQRMLPRHRAGNTTRTAGIFEAAVGYRVTLEEIAQDKSGDSTDNQHEGYGASYRYSKPV